MVDRQVRPVSGEIMTEQRDVASCRGADADVVDAEFETITDRRAASPAPQVRPIAADRTPGPAGGGSVGGMDSLRRKPGDVIASSSRRGGFAFWSFGLTLAAGAFWISGGHTLAGPLFAAFAARQETLHIIELSSRVESSGGRDLLVIAGAVANRGRQPDSVPPLLIEVTGDAGRVTRYTLDSAGAGIAPGAEIRFTSRVDVPIGGVAGVSVKMSERSD